MKKASEIKIIRKIKRVFTIAEMGTTTLIDFGKQQQQQQHKKKTEGKEIQKANRLKKKIYNKILI